MTSMLDNLCIFAKRLRFIRQNTLFLKLMQEKVPKKKAYPVLCFLVPVQDKTTGSHHFHYKFENRHTHPDTHNLLPVALIHTCNICKVVGKNNSSRKLLYEKYEILL